MRIEENEKLNVNFDLKKENSYEDLVLLGSIDKTKKQVVDKDEK